MCAQLMASTDHGVSHEEAGDVRILFFLPLHMLDHISRVGVESLHMYTVTFTSSVANCGKKKFQLQRAHTYVSKLSKKGVNYCIVYISVSLMVGKELRIKSQSYVHINQQPHQRT